MMGETWKDDKKLAASYGASVDYFGSSVAISGDTLLVGAYGKYGRKGSNYVFVLAGDRPWDKGIKLGNLISSGD